MPVEFFPLDAPAQPLRPLGALALGYPDLWNLSSRDYGLRVGIYRVMRALDDFERARDGRRQLRGRRTISSHHRRNCQAGTGNSSPTDLDMGHVHHGSLAIGDERELIRNARTTLMGSERRSPGQRLALTGPFTLAEYI